MPIFEKPPLETIPPVRERWTPLYLEHGRIEVDDSSVKWIGADRMVMRIPVASLSALMQSCWKFFFQASKISSFAGGGK